MFLVGQDTCQSCGSLILQIVDTDAGTYTPLEPTECDACGHEAGIVEVWYHARLYPEAAALVAFDIARRNLHLPMPRTLMHTLDVRES